MTDGVAIGVTVGAVLAVVGLYAYVTRKKGPRHVYEDWYDDPYLRRESSIARDSIARDSSTSRGSFGGTRRRRSLIRFRKK